MANTIDTAKNIAKNVAHAAEHVADAAKTVQEEFLPALDKMSLKLEKVGDRFHATVQVNDRETTHKGSCLSSLLQEVKDTFRRFGAIAPKPKSKN